MKKKVLLIITAFIMCLIPCAALAATHDWNGGEGTAPTVTNGDTVNLITPFLGYGVLTVPANATVTITGSVPMTESLGIMLEIGAGAKVEWKAALSLPGASEPATVNVSGGGTLEVVSGGEISTTDGTAIYARGSGTEVYIRSGSTIEGDIVARDGAKFFLDGIPQPKAPEYFDNIAELLAAMPDSGFTAADFEEVDGKFVISEEKAKEVAEIIDLEYRKIVGRWSFETNGWADFLAVLKADEVTGAQLGVRNPKDITLLKINGATSGKLFNYKISDFEDGDFTLLEKDGAIATTINSGTSYDLVLFIKDDGDYDNNKTPGIVVDPLVALHNRSGGSSGGCNSGFGMLSLILPLMACAFVPRKRK